MTASPGPKVVSCNIELGEQIELAADELLTISGLANADLLLCQELAPEQAELLAERLSWNHHYFAPALHPKTGRPFGNSVMSPWPLTPGQEVELPFTAAVMGQPRASTAAVVEIPGAKVVAYSVHLETVLLRLGRRAEQVKRLAESVTEHTDLPVVVGGDFNAASMRSLGRFTSILEHEGFERATFDDGHTFSRFGRKFALDHIFARGLEHRSSTVINQAMASDHKPVVVVFGADQATSPNDVL